MWIVLQDVVVLAWLQVRLFLDLDILFSFVFVFLSLAVLFFSSSFFFTTRILTTSLCSLLTFLPLIDVHFVMHCYIFTSYFFDMVMLYVPLGGLDLSVVGHCQCLVFLSYSASCLVYSSPSLFSVESCRAQGGSAFSVYPGYFLLSGRDDLMLFHSCCTILLFFSC